MFWEKIFSVFKDKNFQSSWAVGFHHWWLIQVSEEARPNAPLLVAFSIREAGMALAGSLLGLSFLPKALATGWSFRSPPLLVSSLSPLLLSFPRAVEGYPRLPGILLYAKLGHEALRSEKKKCYKCFCILQIFVCFSQALPFNYFQYHSQFNSIKLSKNRISLLNTEFTQKSKTWSLPQWSYVGKNDVKFEYHITIYF